MPTSPIVSFVIPTGVRSLNFTVEILPSPTPPLLSLRVSRSSRKTFAEKQRPSLAGYRVSVDSSSNSSFCSYFQSTPAESLCPAPLWIEPFEFSRGSLGIITADDDGTNKVRAPLI